MTTFSVTAPHEIDHIEAQVLAAADRVPTILAAHSGNGLDLLRRMKFDALGWHPFEGRALNLIEQVNQTFSTLVALKAARILLGRHPDANGYRLILGPYKGTDIESIVPGLVAAEVFAAVSPDSNDKLRDDIERISQNTARHRYVLFHAPRCAEGRYNSRWCVEGIEAWAINV